MTLPEPYYSSGGITLYCGDNREVLKTLDDCSIDSCVTDPPYELAFMGKKWDASGIAYNVDLWREVLRVLKPGGHLLAFGGTRTHHRMVCAIEDAGFEIRDEIQWLYGSGFPKSLDVSKAIDKAAGAEREVVGSYTVGGTAAKNGRQGRASVSAECQSSVGLTRELAITAPATESARQWSGWGTALKPSHEEICWAVKPLPSSMEQRTIVENLTILEAQLWSLLPVNVAEKNFGLSQNEYDAACGFARWTVGERSSTQADLCGRMDTSQFVLAVSSCLSIVSSWRHTFIENCGEMNTFTTGTESSTTIDWKTLRCCLSVLTPHCIILAESTQPGLRLSALPAARVLNAAEKSIQGIRELSVLVSAIASGHILPQAVGEKAVSPACEPICVARKPIEGTVAANVLTHGTGAINVDACRVEGAFESGWSKSGSKESENVAMSGKNYNRDAKPDNPQGRWPANVIHDGSPEVLEAFEKFGEKMSSGKYLKPENGLMIADGSQFFAGLRKKEYSNTFAGDTGTAARFFYTAKADSSERRQSKHPTVKPLDLMRYLVRLVTPIGGVVLDPFTGSGSTIEAAREEHSKAIGIELSVEYCADAVERLRQGVFEFTE